MDQNAIDLGLLILRLVLGVTLALHGVAKYRGGIEGVGRWFESEGLRPGILHAHLAASSEVIFGCAIAAGLMTPLACIGYMGVMIVAGWVGHRKNGFFIIKDGWEYVFVLGAGAASLALLGPGSWSLDEALGLTWSGNGWFLLTVLGGIGSAIALLACFYRPKTDEVPSA
jgi:putative oxidoreductase|tara:strand:- start:351 stop:860 length:510 start_codon:yes stop_codon:yes gene_type:complete